MERLLYRIPEVGNLLGLSRSMVYQEITAGRIKVVRIGATMRVPAEEIRAYVDLLKGEVPSGESARLRAVGV